MLRISQVTPLNDFIVRLRLTDGTMKDVDLDRLLFGPVFASLRADREQFLKVFVDADAGTIAWPNGADIDPDVLIYDRLPARLDSSPPAPTIDLSVTPSPTVRSSD